MMQEELFQKRIKELADMAYQKGIVMFTDFLNLSELHRVNSRSFQGTGVHIETAGGYEFAERQMVAFIPDALSYGWEYPFSCLHIQAKAAKYAEELTHRDYLGSILGLGIERHVLGDILVEEHGAYLFCQNPMTDYLLKNLCVVRRTPVSTALVSSLDEIPKPRLEEVRGTVASCRLDSMIALAFRASRSSIVSSIEGGQVFVNGRLITSNGYSPKEGDIISVRKLGRFQFDHLGNMTKKGRYQILLYRYL